jgi:hypothetical protein
MNRSSLVATIFCSLLGWVASWAQPVVNPGAVDGKSEVLKKIDRKIGKQPDYAKSPKYCQVVFGAEAKFRVWLVIDGDALYMDLNGNGDLTDKGEKFKLEVDALTGFSEPCKVDVIADPNSKLNHKEFTVRLFGDRLCRLDVVASFENPKIPSLYGFADVTFASKPADAPVVHFGGTLKMSMSMATANDRPAFICARIGTPGVGKGSFVDYSKSVFRHLRGKLQPDLRLETPGEKDAVIREKDKFYTDGFEQVYLYPVKLGEKGDKRETKITLSFPDWKDGKVVPSSFSVPIVTLKK